MTKHKYREHFKNSGEYYITIHLKFIKKDKFMEEYNFSLLTFEEIENMTRFIAFKEFE